MELAFIIARCIGRNGSRDRIGGHLVLPLLLVNAFEVIQVLILALFDELSPILRGVDFHPYVWVDARNAR